ncbi:MAG: serine/threonine protein kinase [Fimbriiglobus sp.]|jgi:serine/threonine protein kinase|nr:serine/threonine protein kinase [Fimbriiglobus sp.]
MPALQTPQEFVTAIRRRRLVDATDLRAFVVTARGQALSARRLADRAVATGLLTRFQADEVLAGRAGHLCLGDYRILNRLGAGGTGGVFLATHTPTGERRAVKVLHDDWADDPHARDRLNLEAKSAAALAHPNLVRVFDYFPGDDDCPPFLVMEYVEGVSLQACVALAGTLTAEAAAECGRQAALALQHAWDAGLVHRDIKPANLLLSRDGLVKVLDFGLVRVRRGADLTAVFGRKWLGTAEYIAPEQAANGSAVDCRADIYALGGTVYFLLAGHPPFHHLSWADRLRDESAEPVPIHHLRPDVPAGLSTVLNGMLARRPERRPPDPKTAARQLARWADPAFAPTLFARLDRHPSDAGTESAAVAATPAPFTSASGPPTPCESPYNFASSTELKNDTQETLRVSLPSLAETNATPARWWVGLLWLVASLAAVGILVIGLAVVLSRF